MDQIQESRDERREGSRVEIREYADVVLACQQGYALAGQLGLSDRDQVTVVLAIMEAGRRCLDREDDVAAVGISPFWQDGHYGVLITVREQVVGTVVNRV